MEISWTLFQNIPTSTAFVSYAKFFSYLPQILTVDMKLAGAASGLHYLHSTYGVHGNLKAVRVVNSPHI